MASKKYTVTKLNAPIKISGIYTIHYFKYGKNFNFEPENHDFWELVFIDSGNAQILSGDNMLSLTQGQAILHRPNLTHTIYTKNNFANSAIISFDCKNKLLKNLAERVLVLTDYEKSLLNKIISEAKASYSDKLNDAHLTKMTRKKSLPFASEQIIKNNIELLLISLIRNVENKPQHNEVMNLNITSDKIVDSIREILINKLDSAEHIDLNEISFRVGFSKSYIKSQFKKKTGVSIIQYYIDMKIDKAKKLLSQQKFTISEISDMLGFGSIYYFSRQFKLQTEMSPTEYIKSIKADNIL
ncbi:MAG: AraC family transcriptional regulator [Clostridiales bacterium]|nr:AraC family transcriptional regulator [Clostridiales bacterium]